MSKANVPQSGPTILTIPPTHRDFIVDPLIPTREIMLVAGSSGSGKSTFVSQMMVDLQNGSPFFGRKVSKPPKVGYLAFDRSEAGIKRTLERSIGYEIPFPFYSTITSRQFRSPGMRDPKIAIAHFRSLHPEVNFLTVDGIGIAFKGESGSLSGVATFIQDMIVDMHLSPTPFTICAIHYMAKTKKDAGYEKPREKLHGSVAWAATTETCIIIDTDSNDDSARNIILCPRQGAEAAFSYHFDEDGRLVPWEAPAKEEDDKTNPRQQEFYDLIELLPLGLHTTSVLRDLSDRLAISWSTAKFWLGQLEETQTILAKAGHGKYEIRPR